MSNFHLSKFEKNDLKDLEEIMDMNIDAAGDYRTDWDKFIEWNMKHDDDLNWKIKNSDGVMMGIIGYSDATKKPTSRSIAKHGDLYLAIYLHTDYVGKGIGFESFMESLKLLPDSSDRIYASTYIANTRAHKFLGGKLGMTIAKFDHKYGVTIFEYKINKVIKYA